MPTGKTKDADEREREPPAGTTGGPDSLGRPPPTSLGGLGQRVLPVAERGSKRPGGRHTERMSTATVSQPRPSPFDRLTEQRILVLGESVDEESANRLVAQLLVLSAEDAESDICLFINSPGGSVMDGLAVYDTMQLIPNDVATVAIGFAASRPASGSRPRRSLPATPAVGGAGQSRHRSGAGADRDRCGRLRHRGRCADRRPFRRRAASGRRHGAPSRRVGDETPAPAHRSARARGRGARPRAVRTRPPCGPVRPPRGTAPRRRPPERRRRASALGRGVPRGSPRRAARAGRDRTAEKDDS